MSFQLSDVSKLIPELLLILVAMFVLIDDLSARVRNKGISAEESLSRRVIDAATMCLFGLGLAILVTLLQSGILIDRLFMLINVDIYANTFMENLRAGGLTSEILGGAYTLDPLTHIGRLIFLSAAFITIIITTSAKPNNSPGEYYALIMFSTLGMILMTAAGELIMIYLAIELTSIPLYILAGYFRRNRISTEAGLKYYVFGALSSAILLFGMSLVLGMSMLTSPAVSSDPIVPSTLSQIFVSVQQTFANPGDPGQAVLLLGLIFMLAGMGYKVAVVPFHSWSPDVYQGAPTAITAFISTASKTAGFLLVFRFLLTAFGAPATVGTAALITSNLQFSFGGWTSFLAVIAALTMLFGNLAALPQINVKRLLAYSSIAHAGFLLLGMLGTSRDSGVSLIYYLIVYTITNLGAFGVLALIEDRVGGTDLSDINGLSRRSPGLALILTVFVLSLAGIPPLSGFFAKFYVFIAAWQEGATWLVIFAVLNTVISLFYYLRILKAIYIYEPTTRDTVSVAFGPKLTMTVAMLLVILLGVIPGVFFGSLEQAALAFAQ